MQFIPINEVESMTGVKKTFIYNAIKEGKFPKQIHMGKSALWVKDEIIKYMENKVKERDGESAIS